MKTDNKIQIIAKHFLFKDIAGFSAYVTVIHT